MRIRYAAKTDVGMKRNHNEDYFSLIEDEQLFLVADGMGGHASGEVASKMAAEVMQEFYARTKDDEATWPYKMDRQLSYVENRLVVGIKMANQRIFQAACRDIKFKGMGTTIVSGQVVGDKFYIAHVGDSRCYRIRGATIQQMTRDHSLLEDYKDAKPEHVRGGAAEVPAQERHHARARHARDRAGRRAGARHPGPDVFLLCSDGLSGMIEDAEDLELVKGAPDLEPAVSEPGRGGQRGGRHRQRHRARPAVPQRRRLTQKTAVSRRPRPREEPTRNRDTGLGDCGRLASTCRPWSRRWWSWSSRSRRRRCW